MYPHTQELTYSLERQKTLLGEPIRELPVLSDGRRPGIWQAIRAAAIWLRTELENWGQVPCAEMDPACDMQLAG